MDGDGEPDSRKWLDRLIKNLEATISALEAPSGVKGRVFSRAKLTLYVHNVAWWLKSLRDGCVEERNELGKQGRKPNFRLHGLLGGLEFIFREAGGIVKGISRSDDERESRESPFIDFAWEVLLQVPKSMRPSSHQALAVAWERMQKPKPSREAAPLNIDPAH